MNQNSFIPGLVFGMAGRVLTMLIAICALLTSIQRVSASELPVEGVHISILESTPQKLVVEAVINDYTISTLELDGEVFQRVEIPGQGYAEIAGAPEVPLASAMLGVPTVEGVSLQILDTDYETRSGLRIAPVPRYAATALDLADLTAEELQPELWLDSTIYGQNAWYPQAPAHLGITGALRDQPVAQVQFSPVQYNPVSQETRIYRRIVAQVTWLEQATVAQASARAASPAYEQVLAETLLNYGDLERPLDEIPALMATPSNVADDAATQTLKIYVNKDGIYKVTYDDVVNAGLAPDTIDPRNLKLSNQGVEVPLYVTGQDDGQFDPVDYLLFYGTAITDVYTSENVYWLSESNSAGNRMVQRDGTPGGSGAVPTRFRALLHAEEDTTWWRIMPRGEGMDHWFWFDRISPSTGGLPVSRSYTLVLDHIDTQPGTATIRVQLRGYTSLKHRSKIYLNGTEIDDQEWEGQIIFNHEVEVDQALLQNGDNIIQVESIDVGASVDQYFINWIEIEYWDSYSADNDQLRFQAPAAATFNFEIGGFNGNEVMAFDITNPLAPQRIINAVTVPEGSTTTLKFHDAASVATRYLALHSSQFKTPLSIVLDEPSSWKAATHGADYILITHEDFYSNTLPLAEHRSNSGLRVAVVKVGDLYDEFNGGVFNPKAIRDFLSYAYQNWQAPAPTFVVLVGDANVDYQDFRNTGTVNYVPTQIVDTEIFQALSDTWYAAISGDDILPDLFIGRLSAQNQTQVDDIVAKVIAYDQQPPTEDWKKEVLFISDDDEIAFTDLSEELAGKVPYYYKTNEVYVAAFPPGNPTEAIADHFASGVSLISYTGHGEYFRWGKWDNEQKFIWGLSDIQALQNGSRLPIITVANCLNGYFADRSSEVSIAEAFQRQSNGGAIAILAPSSVGYPSIHRVFMNAFYEALFQEDKFVLGAATTTAMVNGLAQNIFLDELVKTYILFGDPATKANLPVNFPYVESTSPANSATNVAPDQAIQISFSKPVDIATVVLGGSGAAGHSFAPTWNEEHTIVSFAHGGLERGKDYQLTITGQDLAGTPLGEGTAPTTWGFTTSSDVTLPTVSVSEPVISATLLMTLQLHFSESMRPESVVVTLAPEGMPPFFLDWSEDLMIATLTFEEPPQLQPGQIYTLRVTEGNDLAGNALAAPVEKSFSVTNQSFLPSVIK